MTAKLSPVYDSETTANTREHYQIVGQEDDGYWFVEGFDVLEPHKGKDLYEFVSPKAIENRHFMGTEGKIPDTDGTPLIYLNRYLNVDCSAFETSVEYYYFASRPTDELPQGVLDCLSSSSFVLIDGVDGEKGPQPFNTTDFTNAGVITNSEISLK